MGGVEDFTVINEVATTGTEKLLEILLPKKNDEEQTKK